MISAQFSSYSRTYDYISPPSFCFCLPLFFLLIYSTSKNAMTSSLQLCSVMNWSIFLWTQGIFAISKIDGLLSLSLLSTAYINSYKLLLVPSGSGSIGELIIMSKTPSMLLLSNGFLRVVNSYIITPMAHTSALASYGQPLQFSGAMK